MTNELTKREFIAAQIMNGLVSNSLAAIRADDTPHTYQTWAATAIQITDELITQLNKTSPK